jgi:predicted dehydrogenase
MTPLRVGVVGIGHLGTHHARLYADLARASNGALILAGLSDTEPGRAAAAAARHDTAAFASPGELADAVDAVSIATPTETHHEVARMFLERGKHVWWKSRSAGT